MIKGLEGRSLAGIEMLKTMPAAERRRLGIHRWRRYGAHEQSVDRQGDSSDCASSSSRVRVVNYSASGREITLDDIVAGESSASWRRSTGSPLGQRSDLDRVHDRLAAAQAIPRRDRNPSQNRLLVMERLASMLRHSTERIMV